MGLLNSPKAEGHGAYITGKGCPYESGTKDYDLWHEGYREAERAGSKAPPPVNTKGR